MAADPRVLWSKEKKANYSTAFFVKLLGIIVNKDMDVFESNHDYYTEESKTYLLQLECKHISYKQ